MMMTREVKTVSLMLVVAVVGPMLSGMLAWMVASIYIPSKVAQQLESRLEERLTIERETHRLVHERMEAEIDLIRAETTDVTARYNTHLLDNH